MELITTLLLKAERLFLSLLQNYGVVSPREAPAALKENGSPVSIFTQEPAQCDSACVWWQSKKSPAIVHLW